MKKYLKQIRFGSLCAALLVFFLPWLVVTCNGQPLMEQSGIQVAIGDVSGAGILDNKATKTTKSDQKTVKSESKSKEDPLEKTKDVGLGILPAIVFLLLLGATIVAAVELRKRTPSGKIVGFVSGAACALLLLTMVIGFPMERGLDEHNAKQKLEDDDNPFAAQMAAAISIQVERSVWVYIELILLAIPCALLAVKEEDHPPMPVAEPIYQVGPPPANPEDLPPPADDFA